MLSNFNRWAQVGWWEYDEDERHTFGQWIGPNSAVHTMFYDPPKSVGTYTYYTVLYNPSSGVFTFQVNGNTVDTFTAGFDPKDAQTGSEIKTLASQMPGGYNSHAVYTDNQVYMNGSWQAFNGVTNYNSTYFGLSQPSTSEIQTWDQACSI